MNATFLRLTVVLVLASQTVSWAGEPFAERYTGPNPLLATPDARFEPVAWEILRQDLVGVIRPLRQGGVSAAHVVYVDRSDDALRRELKEAMGPGWDVDAPLGGIRDHQNRCLQDVRHAVAETAAEAQAAKDPHGRRRTDAAFYEPYATDPRLYQRAVRLLGHASIEGIQRRAPAVRASGGASH